MERVCGAILCSPDSASFHRLPLFPFPISLWIIAGSRCSGIAFSEGLTPTGT